LSKNPLVFWKDNLWFFGLQAAKLPGPKGKAFWKTKPFGRQSLLEDKAFG